MKSNQNLFVAVEFLCVGIFLHVTLFWLDYLFANANA